MSLVVILALVFFVVSAVLEFLTSLTATAHALWFLVAAIFLLAISPLIGAHIG